MELLNHLRRICRFDQWQEPRQTNGPFEQLHIFLRYANRRLQLRPSKDTQTHIFLNLLIFPQNSSRDRDKHSGE